jgi:hypothetical protein
VHLTAPTGGSYDWDERVLLQPHFTDQLACLRQDATDSAITILEWRGLITQGELQEAKRRVREKAKATALGF